MQVSTTLTPILSMQMRQAKGVVSGDWQSITEARIGSLDGEQRFAAEYSLKALPSGALVRAELLMEGRSASGEAPTTTIGLYRGTGLFDATGHTQWEPAALASTAKWDFNSRARLEIEVCEVEAEDVAAVVAVPSLVVTYVPQDNLLTGSGRNLTLTECAPI